MRYMSSRKIDDFEAFKIYLAMKHHFADKLDYKKYGTTNTKKETYLNRKDKKTFEELSKEPRPWYLNDRERLYQKLNNVKAERF